MSQGAIVNPNRAIPRFRLNNITPFTYRDGLTFLEEIESIKDYITNELLANVDEALSEAYAHSDAIVAEWTTKFDAIIADIESAEKAYRVALDAQIDEQAESFSTLKSALIDDINAAIDDFNNSVAAFIDDVNARVESINEKTGQVQTQYATLTEPKTKFEIDPLWPLNHPIVYHVTQDDVGGRVVEFSDEVSGTVVLNPAPHASTTVTLLPLGGGRFRVASELSALERSSGWIVDPYTSRRVVDTAVYEAFPTLARTEQGHLHLAWGTGSDHFAEKTAKYARSVDGGKNWTTPTTLKLPDGSDVPSIIRIVSVGHTLYAMLMGDAPERVTHLARSTDNGQTWEVVSQIDWGGESWNFACDLHFDNPTGWLYATCYGGNGVLVSVSRDQGVSWSNHSQIVPGQPGNWPYSETAIRRNALGEMLAMVRYESGGIRRMMLTKSPDNGLSWATPWTIFDNVASNPFFTLMSDGSMLVPLRDTLNGESWAYGYSNDHGVTWERGPVSTEWMMYGEFVELPNGRALLAGASQNRGETGNSDIWIAEAFYGVLDMREVDTGWRGISLNPDVESGSSLVAQYRVKDGICYLRGIVKKRDGSDFGVETTIIGVLPNIARPTMTHRGIVAGYGTVQGSPLATGYVEPNGVLKVQRVGDMSTSIIQLSQFPPYPVN